MGIEATAGDHNQDGSIGIKVDGKTIKYVLESDLGAVKASLRDKEGEVSTLQANLATSNTKFDTEHQSVLQERAAKEVAETAGKEGATLKTRVGELETEVTGLKTSSGGLTTKLTDQTRSRLVNGYKIDAEKVKEMTLDDLEKTEANLILVGAKPAQANYDGKNGPDNVPTDTKGMSPLSVAAKAYEEGGKSKID